MRLARIVTEFPEEALELAMQLRSRGFQVETVSPADNPTETAELEVRLEECAAEDALAQVSGMTTGEEVCVFVAPGALDGSSVSTLREMLPARFGFAGRRLVDAGPGAEPTRDASDEAAPGHEAAELNNSREATPDIEAAPAHMSVGMGALREERAEISGSPVADPAEVMEISERNIQRIGEAADILPSESLLEAADATRAVDAAIIEPMTEALPVVGTQSQFAEHNATPALQREREADVATLASDAEDPAGEESPVVPMPPQNLPVARLRSRAEADRAFWKVAVAAAALSTLVVLGGNLWHRARPTPANLRTPAVEQVPFRGGAPAASPSPEANSFPAKATPGAESPDSVETSHSQTVEPQAPPSPAPAVVEASRVEPVPSKRPKSRKHVRSHDAGLIAEDTVVFYDRKPARQKLPPQTGIKQYSDMQ
jgi:hypothetical protein